MRLFWATVSWTSPMIDPVATQFAQALLRDRGQEGAFVVVVPGDEDGGDVARAFECLGCTVEPSPFELSMRVTPPTAAA